MTQQPKVSKRRKADQQMADQQGDQNQFDLATWYEDISHAPVFEITADGGAGRGKFFLKGRSVDFPAVVSQAPLNEAKFDSTVTTDESIVMEWNNFQWAIGNHALTSGNGTMRRLDQEQLGDEIHRAVIIAGILQLLPEGVHKARIKLTTQIPIDFWDKRELLKNSLGGTYKGYFKGELFYIEIRPEDITVHPESRGIVCAYCLDDFGTFQYTFGEKPVVSIDLGAHTGNCGLFKRFTPQRGSFTIANFGWRTVWNHSADVIKKRTGRKPTFDEIEAAVRFNKGVIWIGAKHYDLLNDPDLYPTGYKVVSKQLIATIQDRFRGGSMFAVLIGGGGLWPFVAADFQNQYPEQYKGQEDFDTVKNIDPWMLNALGLERRRKAKSSDADK